MKVAIVGSGNIGANIGLRAAQAGHEVLFSYSRDPGKLGALAAEAGDRAGAAEVPEAIRAAEVVVVSVPWALREDAIPDPSSMADKVVIDTTNPYGPDGLLDLGGTAIARNLPLFGEARVAKAFNTLTARFQAEERERPEAERHAMFFAGEDEAALTAARRLVEAVGFVPVHLGGWDVVELLEAPRRDGSVYGEAYRPEDARRIAEAAGGDMGEARRLARKLKLAG